MLLSGLERSWHAWRACCEATDSSLLRRLFALRAVARLVLVGGFIALLLHQPSAQADEEKRQIAEVVLTELPHAAQVTYRLVLAGGPFSYSQDGQIFANRERRLPMFTRGYYREYTVAAPNAANRGTRRMVCGGANAIAPKDCYYTDDHYRSFRRIVQRSPQGAGKQ